MRIQQNIGMQDISIQDQYSTGSITKSQNGNKNSTTISAANLTGNSLNAQRQGLAKKQALKVVSDAFGGEKKLDAQMQSIKDEIKRLQDEISVGNADSAAIDEKLKELQDRFGGDTENEEYKMASADLLKQKGQLCMDVENKKAMLAANITGYKDMKIERLKSQDMLKAQEAAEDIMDAANGETIALLTQEAVEHVDEEQEEREEAAKEAYEKKKEEKKEEAKKLEKEAMQQEMIENIKEHAADSQRTSADTKRAIARRERAEADRMDTEDIQKTIISDGTSMEDTQNAVNSEITNILNRLSLLSNDVKGSTIDDQI